jgi:hypothetical protein
MLTAGLLVAACSGASDAPSGGSASGAPGTPIADGFVVADGGHEVGPTFHYRRGDETGWRAVIELDEDIADPIGAYDTYVAQARRLGYPVGGSGTSILVNLTACELELTGRSVPLGEVDPSTAVGLTCNGGARSASDINTSVSIAMRWGGTAHHLVLEQTHFVSQFPTGPLPDLGDAHAPRPTSLPSIATDPTPKVGDLFGVKNDAFGDGPYRRFRLERGSEVATEADRLGGDFVAVLHLTDDAKTVMQRYAEQLGPDSEVRGNVPTVKAVMTSAGSVLAIDFSPLGGGGATLFTDPGGKWLIIQAVSD